VARTFGPRAAGVILSGSLDDGTVGLAAIKNAGGLTIVQDPAEAAFPGMPSYAIDHVHPDHVSRLADIASLLVEFVDKTSSTLAHEHEVAAMGQDRPSFRSQPASELTCPDCGGTLWVVDEKPLLFRCRVGHSFAPESLLLGKQDALEAALWAAIVALEERADLSRRLLRRVDGGTRLGRRYQREIEQNERGAAVLKELAAELINPAEPIGEGDGEGQTDGVTS
jgi:two-component system chemotaxis response regulator CheB